MKIILSILLLLAGSMAQAQLSIGSSGMTIVSGTTLVVDSLSLQPSVDMTITSNTLQKSYASLTSTTGNSIARVLTFSSPITFSGVAGFYYRDNEMAGNTESNLQINYTGTYSGGSWTTTAGSTVNTSNNFISNNFTGATLARISAINSGAVLELKPGQLVAQHKAGYVELSWTVGKNESYRSFTVEKANEGQLWSKGETIYATKTTGEASYAGKDGDINFTERYFRIAMEAVDGNSSYTNVALVKLKHDMQVAIQTGSNKAVFTFTGVQPHALRVYTSNGMVVYETKTPQQVYELQALASGNYILSYKTANGTDGVKKFSVF